MVLKCNFAHTHTKIEDANWFARLSDVCVKRPRMHNCHSWKWMFWSADCYLNDLLQPTTVFQLSLCTWSWSPRTASLKQGVLLTTNTAVVSTANEHHYFITDLVAGLEIWHHIMKKWWETGTATHCGPGVKHLIPILDSSLYTLMSVAPDPLDEHHLEKKKRSIELCVLCHVVCISVNIPSGSKCRL